METVTQLGREALKELRAKGYLIRRKFCQKPKPRAGCVYVVMPEGLARAVDSYYDSNGFADLSLVEYLEKGWSHELRSIQKT